MSDTLPSRLRVDALRRLAENGGDTAMILQKGDEDRGEILVIMAHRGTIISGYERRFNGDAYQWETIKAIQEDSQKTAEYCAKRRKNDPDLWLIELDVAQPERFVAVMKEIR